MLLKLLELHGAALDHLPFVGQLVFFVKVGMIKVLQFVVLVLVLDVV